MARAYWKKCTHTTGHTHGITRSTEIATCPGCTAALLGIRRAVLPDDDVVFAAPLLLEGKLNDPAKAKAAGVIDEVVADPLAAAREWVL